MIVSYSMDEDQLLDYQTLMKWTIQIVINVGFFKKCPPLFFE